MLRQAQYRFPRDGRPRAGLRATALALTLAAATLLPACLVAAQGGPGTADLVVDPADGRLLVRRVALGPGGAVTGLDLLARSGIPMAEAGGAVCSLAGVGCPAGDCFCNPARYWAYYHGTPGGGWHSSDDGAALHHLRPGDVEGWAWGFDRPPVSATAATRAVLLGFDWLQAKRLADGSQGSHAGLTAEHVLAARAAGVDTNSLAPASSAR